MANETDVSPANPYEPPLTDSAVAGVDEAIQPLSPGLLQNQSFWGLLSTQFLGAFNDNVFKQLMLLLAIPVAITAASTTAGETSADVAKLAVKDQQGLATFLFSLPFVLFSGYAGFLSDRYSKRTIIVLAKVAEIVVMALGLVAFFCYDSTGYAGLLCVLFLMGTQSAFFGPPKYGLLPQIVRDDELPRANGLILMTTFLAIIFGTALAGGLKTLLMGEAGDASRIWIGSLACVVLAILGTVTSLFIRPLPAQSPQLKFHWDTIAIPRETRLLLSQDRPLLAALLVSSLFWLVAGIAVQAVNSLGKVQLQLSDALASVLTAVIGIGIAVGAVVAGKLTRGANDFRFVKRGAWGMLIALVLLSISLPVNSGWRHLLGFGGSLIVLIGLGAAGGMFAVPVQVFLQTRAPTDQKGRIIAAMNMVNFMAIMFAGVAYDGMDRFVTTLDWPRSPIFFLIALLLLPIVFLKNCGLGEVTVRPESKKS